MLKSLGTFALIVTGAGAVFGGGFYMEFGNPEASQDVNAKGAVVIVRAVGCHSPERTVFTGTAEGIVDGNRKSISLKFTPLRQPGVFAVQRSWPKEGTWALRISGSLDGELRGTAVLPVTAAGVEHFAAPTLHRQVSDEELLAALTSPHTSIH